MNPFQLLEMSCQPRSGAPLYPAAVEAHPAQLPAGRLSGDGIECTCTFRDFHATMAFASAVAWIAHREDHHPLLELSFKRCTVMFSTHSVQGLSLNDFICASKVDAMGASAAPAGSR